MSAQGLTNRARLTTHSREVDLTVSLDLLVTSVATQLMSATAANATDVSQRVLATLVEYFDVDISFLRHNDHERRASVLVTEWPERPEVPDPDPLAVVFFAEADPVFAHCENAKKPMVFRPEPATEEYQRTIQDGSGIPTTSMAAAPLIRGDLTIGTLGFVKIGDREWTEAELNALEAITSLLAQLQGRIAAEERLRYLAEHDDLTGVYNRRALVEHLSARLQPSRPGPVALLFVDLDRLKVINDYLGHTAGDWFIRVFADRLCDDAGESTFIARFGGDEFVVVPAATMGAAAAERLARQLQDRLRQHVDVGGETLARTVSIGVALGTPGRESASDLLSHADQALISAKNAGGNTVAMFTNEISLHSEFRNDIELHLQGVIESDALTLHYLPEIDMRTGQILGMEALVRWQHPTWGMLSPEAFISVAESINLAGELGRWVIRNACAQFAVWRARGLGGDSLLRLNVSPVQLVADGFVESVAATVAEFGLDGGSLCLEITESVVVQDIETTRITLNGLKAAGVEIAIDDFGTGYSVLSHLKSLPVDALKIDKSFVRDLGANAGDLAIIRAIIALADAFNLQVIAEGVETEAAAKTLLDHGCYRAQGFLLSRPLPNEQMEALLTEGQISLALT